jgi:hypothetical protein
VEWMERIRKTQLVDVNTINADWQGEKWNTFKRRQTNMGKKIFEKNVSWNLLTKFGCWAPAGRMNLYITVTMDRFASMKTWLQPGRGHYRYAAWMLLKKGCSNGNHRIG